MAQERILVADDHKENVKFIVDAVLLPHGFKPIVAYNGEEALRKALEEKPDLILLDLQMPKMLGLEVMEKLQEAGLHVPVVLMTFHGSEEIAVKGFRMGARDYVIKPFTVQEMLTAIEGALIESRLRAERDALLQRLMSTNQLLERRLREMRTLSAVGQSVLTVLDRDEVLRRIADAVVYLLPVQSVFILMPDGGNVLHVVSRAFRRQRPAQQESPSAESLLRAHQVLQADEPLVQPAEKNRPPQVFIPLRMRERHVGVLLAQWPMETTGPDEYHVQLLTMLAGYAALAIHHAEGFENLEATKEREKARIQQYFQLYVAPSVVERILSDPDAIQLGGIRQEITILFADLHGFSRISEQMSPEKLVELLNGYLSVMASTVISLEGTLDKFLGDGMMAIFGAPLPQPDHALRAARAALALRKAVLHFHEQLSPRLQLPIRVGVCTGEAVVGNVGTERARNYTAIGDTVNVAHRLMEMAEPAHILISESTLTSIYDHAAVRALGKVPIPGRLQGEHVFELLDLET